MPKPKLKKGEKIIQFFEREFPETEVDLVLTNKGRVFVIEWDVKITGSYEQTQYGLPPEFSLTVPIYAFGNRFKILKEIKIK